MYEKELAIAMFTAEREGLQQAKQYLSEVCPKLLNPTSELVLNLVTQGSHAEALEKFHIRNPSEFSPRKYWRFRGELMYRDGEYKEARSCFYRVSKTEFQEVVGKIGVCSYQLQKYGEALTHLNQATSQKDSPGLYWSYLGLTQLKLHQRDMALRSFEEAKRLNSLTEEAEAQRASELK